MDLNKRWSGSGKTKKIDLIIFCLLLYGINLFSYGQLEGKVFIDQNKNGIKDASEKGVHNAVVSDGYHVVRTEPQGAFLLPGWKKQRFVIIPQCWA